MGKKRSGIILVNYHNETDTLECLDSLFQVKTKHDLTVYLVNVEGDESRLKFERHNLKPTLIQLEKNAGFSGANNLGIKQALAEGVQVVILLNNDTTVDKSFLDPLIETVSGNGVGLVSPKIYFYSGREFYRSEYQEDEKGKVIWYAGGIMDWDNIYGYHRGVNEVDHGQFDREEETDFATGCCVAVSKKVIEKIGLLDEGYFFGLEDLDWSVRTKKLGLKVTYQPKSVIWHKNAGSSGGSGSKLHQYYHNRNRIIFAKKYTGLRTKLALFREGLRQLNQGGQEEKQAVIDGWLGRKGKQKDE